MLETRRRGRFQWTLAQGMIGVALAALDCSVVLRGIRIGLGRPPWDLHWYIGHTSGPSLVVFLNACFLFWLAAGRTRPGNR